MLQNHYTSFSIRNPSDLKTPHTTGPSHPMALKYNTLRPNRTYQPLTHLGHNYPNPSWVTCMQYSRAVDTNMLPDLNDISTQKYKPTSHAIKKYNCLLDYAATYPNYSIQYHASDMILHINTYAAYAVLPKSCSRISGRFYLISNFLPTNDMAKSKLNGPILTICQTLKTFVASAAESETGGM